MQPIAKLSSPTASTKHVYANTFVAPSLRQIISANNFFFEMSLEEMINRIIYMTTFAALTVFNPVRAQLKINDDEKDSATGLSVSTNYDYSTGTYGTAYQLPSTTLSVGVLWDINENWSLDIDLPYLRQTSPVVVGNTTVRVVRIGGKLLVIKSANLVTTLQSKSGQGDVTTLLTRSFDTGAGPVWSVGAKVKLATASVADGLGTGKNDLSIQTGVINDFGALTVGAMAGYTLVGRVSGLQLRDTVYLDLDSSYKLNERWSLGANFSISQAPVADSAAPISASVSANYKIGKKSYLTINMLRGFSDGSPKWGAGLGVNVGF